MPEGTLYGSVPASMRRRGSPPRFAGKGKKYGGRRVLKTAGRARAAMPEPGERMDRFSNSGGAHPRRLSHQLIPPDQKHREGRPPRSEGEVLQAGRAVAMPFIEIYMSATGIVRIVARR